jgi:hypothetical protein
MYDKIFVSLILYKLSRISINLFEFTYNNINISEIV